MIYFFIIFFILFFIFIYYSKKFSNPYILTMIFGKKGSGKTTLLTKLSIKYNKMGYKVFSNVEIFGCYKLNIKDIGYKDFPINSVILIDEVSLIWDNRNFKSFDMNIAKYFRLMRHHKNICFMFSQTFDIDKKLRDLCDQMYLLVNIGGFLSIAKKIKKVPTLHQPQKDESGSATTEGFITEDYSFYSIFSWIFTFIPRYIKFFNSFELEEGIKVKRRKYKFNNESYLYKLTHYGFYKKDQLKDIYIKFKKYMHTIKFSFNVKFDEFVYLNQN